MNKKGSLLLSRHGHDYRVVDEDLWPDILKRLPIKSLCRFRSVCKRLNSLISSAFFINHLHLSFTRSSLPCHLKPYLHLTSNYGRRQSYALYRPLDNDVEHFRQRLHCPFQDHTGLKYRFTFVEVIHGIICISYYSPFSYKGLLWNPSVHKYVALPHLSLPCHYHAIGFGYDTTKNDFKVVLVWKSRVRGADVTYQVYSTRQGFWRPSVSTTVAGIVRRLDFKTEYSRCCFVNGTIHWLVLLHDDECYFLLMFDCESEGLTSINLPEKLWGSSWSIEPLEYVGMLAVLVEHDSPTRIELWVMEEHGVSNSWKKLYTICPDKGVDEGRITVHDPSYENVAPYDSPNNPCIYYERFNTFQRLMSDHVYDETMLLMDHPQAQSYTNKEVVFIST